MQTFSSACNKYITTSKVTFEGREKPAFGRRLHLASHGYMGRAFKLLELAAERAVGEEAVTNEHLSDAWEARAGFLGRGSNPFQMALQDLMHLQSRDDYAAILEEWDTPPPVKRRR